MSQDNTIDSQKENKKNKTLGKGLGALLGVQDAIDSGSTAEGGIGRSVSVNCLVRGDSQPRQEFNQEQLDALADSIRQNGILQPILVRPMPDEEGTYEIIAGERRWRAAKQAELAEVPVIVREMSDAKALGIALIENLQREDLSPVEEAEGYERLKVELSYTQEQIAEVIGKSRSHIANILRITGLPASVKSLIRDGRLSVGHAKILSTTHHAEDMAQTAVKKGLNVRQLERLVKKIDKPYDPVAEARAQKRRVSAQEAQAGQGTMVPISPASDDMLLIESELSDLIGRSVRVIPKQNNAGEICIPFSSLDDFDEILASLSKALGGKS